MTKIAFVDTETTGLDRQRHDMWELAMEVYEVDDHGRLDRYIESVHTFTIPDMYEADPTALRMNKFYERTNDHSFEWAQDEYAVAAHVATILGTDNCHLAGMQVDFDDAFISRWLRSHVQVSAAHYHIIEIESAMAAALRGEGKPVPMPWKSDNLSKALGVEPPAKDERHTAMADARWARRVYEEIFGSNLSEEEAAEADLPDWATEDQG